MPISDNIIYLNAFKTGLTSTDNEKYKTAARDLPQEQRIVLEEIFKGKAKVNSSETDKIVTSLKAYEEAFDQADAAQRKKGISVRTSPRKKSWYKSVARFFSNWGSRLGSDKLIKNIVKSKIHLEYQLTDDEVKITDEALDNYKKADRDDSQKLPTVIPPDQFISINAILTKNKVITATVEGSDPKMEIAIWKKSHHIIMQPLEDQNNATKENRLELLLDSKGKIISLIIDGQEQSDLEIPDRYLPYITAAYKECVKQSSTYTGDYHLSRIKVISKGVKEDPDYHLSKLIHVINNRTGARLDITFLNPDLSESQGMDAGGLSRDYLDDLGHGLMKNSTLNLEKLNGTELAFPMTKASASKSSPIPPLNNEECEKYTQIGKLLMFCYNSDNNNSQNYTISQCFDESVFAAALSLKKEEVYTPFDQLSQTTIKTMCQAMVRTQLAKNDHDSKFEHLLIALDVLDWTPKKPLPSKEVLSCAYEVFGSAPGMNPIYDLFTHEDTFECLYGKIEENPEIFMKLAQKAILTVSYPFEEGAPGRSAKHAMPCLGERLAPVHQIAQGMISTVSSTWNDFHTLSPSEFNEKAQGSLDPEQIIAMIPNEVEPNYGSLTTSANLEILKKVEWLKEWIRDPTTTKQDLQELLKFITGSSSLVSGAKIIIKAQSDHNSNPQPIAHTCFNTIEIAQSPCGVPGCNDHTKDEFINALKMAIKDQGINYSTR